MKILRGFGVFLLTVAVSLILSGEVSAEPSYEPLSPGTCFKYFERMRLLGDKFKVKFTNEKFYTQKNDISFVGAKFGDVEKNSVTVSHLHAKGVALVEINFMFRMTDKKTMTEDLRQGLAVISMALLTSGLNNSEFKDVLDRMTKDLELIFGGNFKGDRFKKEYSIWCKAKNHYIVVEADLTEKIFSYEITARK
ncbi:MAG: hypothetical protein J6O04_03620 [Selenomonadaceae bacterium]|nr:hypothetical protein [Selenomonadaceae bacterium]